MILGLKFKWLPPTQVPWSRAMKSSLRRGLKAVRLSICPRIWRARSPWYRFAWWKPSLAKTTWPWNCPIQNVKLYACLKSLARRSITMRALCSPSHLGKTLVATLWSRTWQKCRIYWSQVPRARGNRWGLTP